MFTSDPCPGCDRAKPMIKKLQDSHLFDFKEISANKEQALVDHYNVWSTPTFIMFLNDDKGKWTTAVEDVKRFVVANAALKM